MASAEERSVVGWASCAGPIVREMHGRVQAHAERVRRLGLADETGERPSQTPLQLSRRAADEPARPFDVHPHLLLQMR